MTKILDILCGVTVAVALMGAVIAAVPRSPAGDRSAPDPARAQAMGHTQAMAYLRAHQYAAAYGRLSQLADAGHAPSAEVALLMLRNGRLMFGAEWSATVAQQRRWFALAFNAACGGPAAMERDAGD
jgi:hypothetical protein